jgi:hypothetical protein
VTIPPHTNQIGNTTSTAISGVNDAIVHIMTIPQTGTLDQISFIVATKTTNGTIDVRLETVDTTVNPAKNSGTLYATGSNGAVTVNAANTKFTATLGTPPSVTKGDLVAIVLKNPASAPPNFAVRETTQGGNLTINFPYDTILQTGVWAATNDTMAVMLHYSSPSGTFPELQASGTPAGGITTLSTFGSASTPNRYGAKFTALDNWQVTGAWFYAKTDGTNNNCTIKLYDNSNNVLASVNWNSRLHNGSTNNRCVFVEFPASTTLTAGNIYRISVEPQSASQITGMLSLAFASADDSLSCWMGANGFYRTTSSDGTTWTDSTTECLYVGLLVTGSSATPSTGLGS